MFSDALIFELTLLADERLSERYEAQQQALAKNMPANYEELVDIVYDFDDEKIRIEALEIVLILKREQYENVIYDLMKADPSENVRKYAKGLALRYEINKRLSKFK